MVDRVDQGVINMWCVTEKKEIKKNISLNNENDWK